MPSSTSSARTSSTRAGARASSRRCGTAAWSPPAPSTTRCATCRWGERPSICVSASAIGIYGARDPEHDCREDEHDATQFAPRDFLAHVCKEWEAAARRLERLGLRVVRLRIGVVLGRGGGALERMEPLARLHANLTLGSGRQMVSWIHVHDLVRVVQFALRGDALEGPVNATAPNPVTNRDLAKGLARAMGKGSLGPALPAFAARMMFGKGRAAVLLEGARVLPYQLQEHGFRFQFPTLDEALGDLYRAEAEQRALARA